MVKHITSFGFIIRVIIIITLIITFIKLVITCFIRHLFRIIFIFTVMRFNKKDIISFLFRYLYFIDTQFF